MTKPGGKAMSVRQLRKKGRGRRKRSEWLVSTAYLLPSLAGGVLFFFLPLIMILVTSTQKSVTNSDFVGMDNYSAVLGNQAFILATKNTFLFSALAVPLAVILALLLALLLNTEIPGRSWFRSIFLN